MITKPLAAGYGRIWYNQHVHPPVAGTRTVTGPSPSAGAITTMSGPAYKGMDPSDPSTWRGRPYNPAPGMVAQLNFDGAARSSVTPMGGVQRGKTGSGRIRLRIGAG